MLGLRVMASLHIATNIIEEVTMSGDMPFALAPVASYEERIVVIRVLVQLEPKGLISLLDVSILLAQDVEELLLV